MWFVVGLELVDVDTALLLCLRYHERRERNLLCMRPGPENAIRLAARERPLR